MSREGRSRIGSQLPMTLATADRDDLVRVIQINAFDGHRVAEDLRREGTGQVLLQHAQKPTRCSDSPYASTMASSISASSCRLFSRRRAVMCARDGYAAALCCPKVSAQAFG